MPWTIDHLTMVLMLRHTSIDGESTNYETHFSQELKTSEQSYKRNTVAGEEWTPVDTGWLKSVDSILICNDEKDTDKVLKIAYSSELQECWLIPAGRFMCVCPDHQRQISICCESGKAQCTILAIPK